MATTEIKTGRIKAKGFDISIGKRTDQIALISHSTDDFTPFKSIKKSGRLAKIKRMFKGKLCSSEQFFFEGMTHADIIIMFKILK